MQTAKGSAPQKRPFAAAEALFPPKNRANAAALSCALAFRAQKAAMRRIRMQAYLPNVQRFRR